MNEIYVRRCTYKYLWINSKYYLGVYMYFKSIASVCVVRERFKTGIVVQSKTKDEQKMDNQWKGQPTRNFVQKTVL